MAVTLLGGELFPSIKNAKRPNMRCSVTPGSARTSSRIRLARSGSYATGALSLVRADQLHGGGDELRVVCGNATVRQHERVLEPDAHIDSGGGGR